MSVDEKRKASKRPPLYRDCRACGYPYSYPIGLCHTCWLLPRAWEHIGYTARAAVKGNPRGSLDIQREIDRRKSRDRWRMALPGWALNAAGAVIFTLTWILIWGMVEVWWG